jgi:phosphatidylserine/phosphatidylglycerophosphate/cardiolipin synthase-like enzyme
MSAPTPGPAAEPTPPPSAFEWDGLGRYKAEGRFLEGYPADFRTFWAPRDDVHGVLVSLLSSAQRSLVLNMYGYDDDELDEIIRRKIAEEQVYVQMSLDRNQAGGKHEREILARWHNDAIGSSIAIGTSIHHAISHLKVCIVDGLYTIRGSTNWSASGETRQDNELTISRDPVIAIETRAILDVNHDYMLKQMAARAQPRTAAETRRARPSVRTRASLSRPPGAAASPARRRRA